MENNTTVSLTINPLGYQHKNEEPETKTIRFQYPEGYNKQKFFADGLEKSFPAVQADQFVKIGIAVLIGDEVAETTEGQGTPETTEGDIKEVPAVNADILVEKGIAVLLDENNEVIQPATPEATEVETTTEGQEAPETTEGDIKEVPAVNADAANVTDEVKETPKQKAVEAPKAKGSGKK